MNKLFIAIFVFASTLTTTVFAEIKVGIILGFTGPIETLTPAMADSAELAFNEASDSGSLLNGETISVIRADSTCKDSDAATAAAEGVIAQGVTSIIGAVCSEVTKSILSNSVIPNKMVMISPAATSLKLISLDDRGYFFRTAPSDTRGGQVLADITKDRKVRKVAVTYTNDDYGKGLAEAYKVAVETHGIKVTSIIVHEDNKTDYSSEVATLASAGGDAMAIIGYHDQGGKRIIQASLDSGAFDKFILSDQMIDQSLIDTFAKQLKKSFGYIPGSTGRGRSFFTKIANINGINSLGPYTGESYDAAAIIVLAMQAAGSNDGTAIAKKVIDIANGPGTKIYPGEIKKGLDLLAKGKKIDYEGATGVTFNSDGGANGSFLEQEIKGKKFKTKKQR